jgi:hypothetical protein
VTSNVGSVPGTIFARDGQRGRIDCGTEYDVAVVDKIDHVRHCERVLGK